jgi:DNA polymerase elongation subunit (family B)
VGSQPATEALPLVMEPESRMYSCPVVVLDFQSLYPSMVIAYNLCYTTMVGRPAHAAAAVAAAAAAVAAAAEARTASQQQQQQQQHGGAPVGRPCLPQQQQQQQQQASAGGGLSGSQAAACSAAGLLQQQPPGTGIRLGVSSYSPPVAALAPGGAADADALVIAASGVAFLPQRARPGVLPRLLHEILATRVMVKAAMKRS